MIVFIETCGKQYPVSNLPTMVKNNIILQKEHSTMIFFYNHIVYGQGFEKNKNIFIRTHLWPRKMPHRSKSKGNRRVHVCPRNVSNRVNQHCDYEPRCQWSCKLRHSALINNTKTSRTTSHEHQKISSYNLRKHLPHPITQN